MADKETWNVDHGDIPFANIRDEFLTSKHLTLQTIPLVEGKMGRNLTPEMTKEFRKFHEEQTKMGTAECTLRIVRKDAHAEQNRIDQREKAKYA